MVRGKRNVERKAGGAKIGSKMVDLSMSKRAWPF